ncbi:MAG: cation-translocating P-type ATPase [Solirubrobacteraceae bacterium]|nr:cation-translocating P-type ATPase [Solirubrobacteraceae bacterium]
MPDVLPPTAPDPHAAAASDVTTAAGVDPGRGLTAEDAQTRLAIAGPNRLREADEVSATAILTAQITAPMILLLAAAAVLSAALGDVTEAIVIAVVIVLNAWIGFRQEYRAERAMASLQAMAAPVVTVLRDGAATTAPATDVVPGDVVLLEAGARVPADGRLLEAHALRVEESPLTGESVPVEKHTEPVPADTPLAERTSMAFAGTSVAAGRATMVVTATGMDTQLGHVAELLHGADPGRTPLQQRLDTLVRNLALAAGAVVVLVIALGALGGESLETLLLTAVSLAVAAIPESLPAVVTITLALGAQRMLRKHALIRRLYAVETLGSVTTICSDKTGTLTQNRMTVVVLDMAGDRRDLSDAPEAEHPDPDALADPVLRLLLAGGALCNDTQRADDGSLLGDPTETALVAVASRYGLEKHDLDAALPRLDEHPFDSDRKRMTTVHALPGDVEAVPAPLRDLPGVLEAAGRPDRLAFTKGAVDGLLPRCTTVNLRGEIVPFDAELRRRALAATEELAGEGVRVLGVAYRAWPDPGAIPTGDALEQDLTFVGFEGMVDPARPEVRDAVATCRAAGVRPVMITGDHPLTAAAIGRDLGLIGPDDQAMTGAELEGLDRDALHRAVREVSVFARVSPQDKIAIVEALREQGHVAAMTGDGVNDAPALKQADIGVAMGITGTDVTKDAADMVLLDDNFATIVSAVGEGRVVFDNIRKFIRNILSGNFAEVGVMVVAPLAGMPLPLLPLQILWLNLVTDGLPAMAFAVEPAEPGVMKRPPTPLGESLLGSDRGRRIVTRGTLLLVLTFVPAYLLWNGGDDAWQSVLFTSIAFAELAGGFAMRSERVSVFTLGVFSNRALVGAVALTVVLQVLLIVVPWSRDILGLEALGAEHWALCVGIAVTYFAAIELEKLVVNARRRARTAAR